MEVSYFFWVRGVILPPTYPLDPLEGGRSAQNSSLREGLTPENPLPDIYGSEGSKEHVVSLSSFYRFLFSGLKNCYSAVDSYKKVLLWSDSKMGPFKNIGPFNALRKGKMVRNALGVQLVCFIGKCIFWNTGGLT